MTDFDLTQSDAQIQGILNAIQPFYDAGDLNALGFGYGNCSTDGGTVAKTVDIANTILTKGGCISVNFQKGFTVDNPTLSVNGSNSYPILMYGSAIQVGKVRNNTILTMRFDGNNFNVVSILSQFKPPIDAVDLDLPSGLLWCCHNVGAVNEEDMGYYFSWGNIDGHSEGSGYNFSLNVYKKTTGGALTTSIGVGGLNDAVRQNQEKQWKIPRQEDIVELVDNCVSEWTTKNGVNGRKFTSKNNGYSIFIPAAGYYNGTTLNGKGVRCNILLSGIGKYGDSCSTLFFNSTEVEAPSTTTTRFLGFSMRGVC